MRRAWLALACICSLSCAGSHAEAAHAAGPALDPGPIRSPAVMPYDLQWRQHVTASWPTGRRSFDAVVQQRHGELMMIGLSPAGMPGFVLRLKPSGAIEVENRTGQELPFRPEYILADVQRVLYPWLPPPAAGLDGELQGEVAGLRVRERYVHGALVERTFQRAAPTDKQRAHAADGGSVRIVYERGSPGADVAKRVSVDNGWFGYRLQIETLSQSRLSDPPRP
jgi:hypothetical protein